MTELDTGATAPRLKRFPPRRRRRTNRRVAWLVGVIALVLLVLYVGVGWYVSSEIIAGLGRGDGAAVAYDADVVSVSDDRIEVRPSPDDGEVAADADAIMGLRWDGGYGQVGPVTSTSGGVQTRPFTLLTGHAPPTGDDVADFHSYAFPSDRDAAGSLLGIDIETVTYPGPLGELSAWYVPGDRSTWIVGVHGLGGEPAEFLRMVEAVGDLGYPMLMVHYRNDPGAPQTDDGLLKLGQDEWHDVAAALDWARGEGAQRIVMYGASLGGAISLSYAVNADDDQLQGLILDSPAADLRQIVSLRSGEALPVGGAIGESFLAVGRLFTSWRIGLDFDAVDYVARADELDEPILLFHGTEDEKVPFAVGQSLEDAAPDLVEFEVLEDAAHVRAWNEDPERYEAIVEDFLAQVADG